MTFAAPSEKEERKKMTTTNSNDMHFNFYVFHDLRECCFEKLQKGDKSREEQKFSCLEKEAPTLRQLEKIGVRVHNRFWKSSNTAIYIIYYCISQNQAIDKSFNRANLVFLLLVFCLKKRTLRKEWLMIDRKLTRIKQRKVKNR